MNFFVPYCKWQLHSFSLALDSWKLLYCYIFEQSNKSLERLKPRAVIHLLKSPAVYSPIALDWLARLLIK